MILLIVRRLQWLNLIGWNERIWRRLGIILSQNTNLTVLSICKMNIHMVGLCAGLKHNRYIQEIEFCNRDYLDYAESMNVLAPIQASLLHTTALKLYQSKRGLGSIITVVAAHFSAVRLMIELGYPTLGHPRTSSRSDVVW